MKLNKQRQKLYLDGKVGLINDGTVEQLREVLQEPNYQGTGNEYYRGPSNVTLYPIAWFYEENELPKKIRVDKATQGTEWYKDYIGTAFNVVRDLNSDDYIVEHLGSKSNYLIAKSDCTPITETNNELPKRVKYMGTEYDVVCETYPYYRLSCGVVKQSDCTTINETAPTSYKLKIDIPEWLLKAGDEIELGRLPRSIIEHIATPCTTFTLENGTQIELTENDIDKIKKTINYDIRNKTNNEENH